MASVTNVEISSGLNGYVARAAGNRRPGVIVIMEAFGVTGHIRGACDRLAAAGFTAVAPDIFHGDLVDYGDMDSAIAHIKATSDATVQHEIGLSIDWLRGNGAPSVGIIGFCMGGRLSFMANCRHAGKLKAAVGFYGGGIGPEAPDRLGRAPVLGEADGMQAPVFLGYGADDGGITAGEHANITRTLSGLKKTFALKVYQGAGHAFLCEERPKNYVEGVARGAWLDIIDFFSRNLTA